MQLTDDSKSLISSKNSNGPRIEPSGSPKLLVNRGEVFSIDRHALLPI